MACTISVCYLHEQLPLWVAGRGGVQQVYWTQVVMIDCLKQHSIPPLAAMSPNQYQSYYHCGMSSVYRSPQTTLSETQREVHTQRDSEAAGSWNSGERREGTYS